MTEAANIAKILGGRRTLGTTVRDADDLIRLSRAGLPSDVVGVLSQNSGLTRDAIGHYLAMSRRTLFRRGGAARLKPVESDRAMRLARAIARAEAAIGDVDKARAWLTRPNRALGMHTPMSLLDTDTGAQRVLDVLSRLEQGTFS